MRNNKMLTLVSLIILIIGGINWGFVGLLNINIISAIFGSLLSRLLYIVIGIAAAYLIYSLYLEKGKTNI